MRAKLGILAVAIVLAMVLAFCALTDETNAPPERGLGHRMNNDIVTTIDDAAAVAPGDSRSIGVALRRSPATSAAAF